MAFFRPDHLAREIKQWRQTGSALLLVIVIVGVISTTALGAIAVAYDQLSTSDRVNNAEVAKLAASSGVARLREQLNANSFSPEAFNLTKNQTIDLHGRAISTVRPNPRDQVFSIDTQTSDLPRCLAVAVINPWMGRTASYNLSTQPITKIFHYANVVNGTPLGYVADQTGDNLADDVRTQDISSLTKIGQFYNPYAANNIPPSQSEYWLINLGGPQDQFLSHKAQDGRTSFYKGLDFIYIPYLPRFTDGALLRVDTQGNPTGLDNKSADELQRLFEQTIMENNFKVWIDGAGGVPYSDGIADLFTSSTYTADQKNKYRAQWLQPSLPNDLPEADIAGSWGNSFASEEGWVNGAGGPYRLDYNIDNFSDVQSWQPLDRSQWVRSFGAADGGWAAEIVRGSTPFSFAVPSGDLNRSLTDNMTINVSYFGPDAGLRTNTPFAFNYLLKKGVTTGSPTTGNFGKVKITNINNTDPNHKSLTLQFSTVVSQSRFYIGQTVTDRRYKLSDFDAIRLSVPTGRATTQSVTSLEVQADSKTIKLSTVTDCPNNEFSYKVCPAAGDIVRLSKAGQSPLWGTVTISTYDNGNLKSFKLDKLRQYPLNQTQMASTRFIDNDGKEKVAYYGGQMVTQVDLPDFNDISQDLWVFDPAKSDITAWKYYDGSGGPGRRAGAAIAPTQQTAKGDLILTGGYRHEARGSDRDGKPCGDNYYLNISFNCGGFPNGRVAKIYPAETWKFTTATGIWSRVTKAVNDNDPNINQDTRLTLRSVSRLSDRTWSGGLSISRNLDNPVTLDARPDQDTSLHIASGIAGLAIGDVITITQPYEANVNKLVSLEARITAIPAFDRITVRLKDVSASSGNSISLNKSLMTVGSYSPLAASVDCQWDKTGGGDVSKANTCLSTNVVNLRVGDAIKAELYDDPNNPARLVNSYSGYVAKIVLDAGRYRVYFVDNESVAGFRDYSVACDFSAAGACKNQTVRARPLSQSGATFEINGDGAGATGWLWQGSQTIANTVRTTALTPAWKYLTSSSEWQQVPLNLTPLPSNRDLEIVPLILTNSTSVFSTTASANNTPDTYTNTDSCGSRKNTGEGGQTNQGQSAAGYNGVILPDKCVNDRLVWDTDKTWTLEVDTEGLSAITSGQLVVGSTITLARSRFDTVDRSKSTYSTPPMIVTEVQLPNGAPARLKFKIKSPESYAGSSVGGIGLAPDAADGKNIKIFISFPTNIGNNSISVVGEKFSQNTVISDRINDSLKLPVGNLVAVRERSGDFPTSKFYIAQIGERQPVYSGATLTGLKFVSSGPVYPNSPINSASSANSLVNNSQPSLIHLADYFFGDRQEAVEWVFDTSSNSWRARFSKGEDHDKDVPSLRKGGTAISTGDGSARDQVIVAGGTTQGPLSNHWDLTRADNDNRARWRLQPGSTEISQSLPNVNFGNLTSLQRPGDANSKHKTLIAIGGQLPFSANQTSSIGPRVLGVPYNANKNANSSTVVDGTLDNSQFTDLLAELNNGTPVIKSISFTTETSNRNQDDPADNRTVCKFIGQKKCTGQSIFQLGTLGGWGLTTGTSLAVINPGSRYKYAGSERSLILSGPALSLDSTDGQSTFDGYYPYICDDRNNGNCNKMSSYGQLSPANEVALKNSKTLMLAGHTVINPADFPSTCPPPTTACGSILITPVGVGAGVAVGSGPKGAAGPTSGSGGAAYYCNKYTVEDDSSYTCNSDIIFGDLPQSEDLLFMFNAAKTLSNSQVYRVVGYYGGVKRGFLVTERPVSGVGLGVQEIYP